MPKDSRIAVREVINKVFAVYSFSGRYNEENFKKYEMKLNEWLSKRADMAVSGETIKAGYDAPYTIPFFRKNEVMIPIKLNNHKEKL
jgi:hypothetical protein